MSHVLLRSSRSPGGLAQTSYSLIVSVRWLGLYVFVNAIGCMCMYTCLPANQCVFCACTHPHTWMCAYTHEHVSRLTKPAIWSLLISTVVSVVDFSWKDATKIPQVMIKLLHNKQSDESEAQNNENYYVGFTAKDKLKCHTNQWEENK